MALAMRDRNGGPSSKSNEIAPGLMNSKWATGGEYHLRSQAPYNPSRALPEQSSKSVQGSGSSKWPGGASNDINPQTYGHSTRPNAHLQMELEPSQSSATQLQESTFTVTPDKGPDFVRPKATTAVIVKDPVSKEIVDRLAWKSSSASSTRSQSPNRVLHKAATKIVSPKAITFQSRVLPTSSSQQPSDSNVLQKAVLQEKHDNDSYAFQQSTHPVKLSESPGPGLDFAQINANSPTDIQHLTSRDPAPTCTHTDTGADILEKVPIHCRRKDGSIDEDMLKDHLVRMRLRLAAATQALAIPKKEDNSNERKTSIDPQEIHNQSSSISEGFPHLQRKQSSLDVQISQQPKIESSVMIDLHQVGWGNIDNDKLQGSYQQQHGSKDRPSSTMRRGGDGYHESSASARPPEDTTTGRKTVRIAADEPRLVNAQAAIEEISIRSHSHQAGVKPDVPGGMWPNPFLAFQKKEEESQQTQCQEQLQVTRPLTDDALIATFGSKPRLHDPLDFDDRISNDGVAKEAIRATQGTDDLLDWDGKSWAPGPCDWENERPRFDASFVSTYINEWRSDIPAGLMYPLDTSTEKFSMGKEAINNGIYEDHIIQPDSLPDNENSSDNMKRVHQSSDIEAHNYFVTQKRKQAKKQRNEQVIRVQTQKILSRAPERNPFSPKIALYMRPAEDKDADGLAEVYNYYIKTSIIPEDNDEFTKDDAIELIKACKQQKLPIIVSIVGRVPTMTDVQGRRGNPTQSMLPSVEQVIGFAFAERFNCSLNCKTTGRSRFTCNLHVYTHHEYTRKGVGRNLMDRLIHMLSRAYAYKEAAEWINPRNDLVNETEGSGTWHQMLVNIPVERKNDPNLAWMEHWLYSQNAFWFKEHYRMKSVGKSNPHIGVSRWLDIAVFQCEAAHEGVFGPFE